MKLLAPVVLLVSLAACGFGAPSSSQGGPRYQAGTGISIDPSTYTISSSVTSTVPALFFGTGGDGACNFDGVATVLGIAPSGSTYTLTRNIYCSSITVGAGVTVDPNGYVIRDSGALTFAAASSHIAFLANAGVQGAGNAGGAGGAAKGGGSWLGQASSVAGVGCCGGGAVGNDGSSSVNSVRPCAAAAAVASGGTPAQCQGGPGGSGSTAGGKGGAVSMLSNMDINGVDLYDIVVAMDGRSPNGTTWGGTSAGGSGVNGNGAGCGGAGGGGASGGPVVLLAYGPITGPGTVEAKGGNGGPGQQTGCTGCATGPNICTATGGGGGAGGILVEVIGTGSFPSSSVAGGTGGIASPLGPAAGTDGGSGVLIQARAGF